MTVETLHLTVEGKPYVVQVDDLTASPLTVRVNDKPFVVEVMTDGAEVLPGAASADVAPPPAAGSPAPPPAGRLAPYVSRASRSAHRQVRLRSARVPWGAAGHRRKCPDLCR